MLFRLLQQTPVNDKIVTIKYGLKGGGALHFLINYYCFRNAIFFFFCSLA